MRVLKIPVYGVSCYSKWVQDTIFKFLRGKCQYVDLTDANKNVKNKWYQNIGGSCNSVMEGSLFYPFILYILAVYQKFWNPEYFTSYHMVLNISIHDTIKNLVKLDTSNRWYVLVACVALYFMRLHLYYENTKESPW